MPEEMPTVTDAMTEIPAPLHTYPYPPVAFPMKLDYMTSCSLIPHPPLLLFCRETGVAYPARTVSDYSLAEELQSSNSAWSSFPPDHHTSAHLPGESTNANPELHLGTAVTPASNTRSNPVASRLQGWDISPSVTRTPPACWLHETAGALVMPRWLS